MPRKPRLYLKPIIPAIPDPDRRSPTPPRKVRARRFDPAEHDRLMIPFRQACGVLLHGPGYRVPGLEDRPDAP